MIITIAIVILAIIVLFSLYLQVTKPNSRKEKDGTITFIYDKPPSPLDFYLRVIFSISNFTKPGYFPSGKTIPKFQVICKNGSIPSESLKKFLKICAFKQSNEIPLTLPFASGTLPMVSSIFTHATFPLKSMPAVIHMKQTIELLRPLQQTDLIAKRGLVNGGTNTERGSEFDVALELYNSSTLESSSLLGRGTSSFLIIKKKKKTDKTEEKEIKEDMPPLTRKSTFKVGASTGVQYASATGDYNPWHLYPFTAKIFGFRKPIAQGYWSVSRCIAEIGDDAPKYPLSFQVDWKRPLFMPSSVTLSIYKTETKVFFELHSEDMKHLHLVGKLEHVPDMKLVPL